MKNILLLIMISIAFSCKEKKEIKNCQQKIAVLQAENDSLHNTTAVKFDSLLSTETQSIKDSVLINKYKSLLGNNDLFDLYIWDRIHTIGQYKNLYSLLKNFNGKYSLKPMYSSNNAPITNIEIKNDTCYLLKNGKILFSDKINLINSSTEYIKGKIIINRFIVNFVLPKLLTLNDNSCMDCPQWQFQ